jgi:hypothetical protein
LSEKNILTALLSETLRKVIEFIAALAADYYPFGALVA